MIEDDLLKPDFEEAIIEDSDTSKDEIKSFKDMNLDDIEVIEEVIPEDTEEEEEGEDDDEDEDGDGKKVIDEDDIDNTNDFVLSLVNTGLVGIYDKKNFMNPSSSKYSLTNKERDDLSRLSKKVLIRYNMVLGTESLLVFMLIGIFSKRALIRRNEIKVSEDFSPIGMIIDISEEEKVRTSFVVDSRGYYVYHTRGREYIKESERSERPSQFVLRLVERNLSSKKIRMAIDIAMKQEDE